MKDIKAKQTINSSFWIAPTASIKESKQGKDILKVVKLVQLQKAITNFVKILTGREIPVEFNQCGTSYTDGETIVIGAEVEEDKDIDIQVGLALHEASHIVLTDMNTIARWNIELTIDRLANDGEINKNFKFCIDNIADLFNWIEDRRIDQYVKDNAPGYIVYYKDLEDKYFNDKSVTKGILSNYGRDETVESYMFRIINLLNKHTDLDALKNLRAISDLINLPTISRLKKSQDALDLAIKVYDLIDSASSNSLAQQNNNNSEKINNKTNDKKNSDKKDESLSTKDKEKINKSTELQKKKTKVNEKKVKKAFKKQRKYLNHDIKKKKITQLDHDLIDAIGGSGIEFTKTASDIPIIIVRNLTKKLIDSNTINMLNSHNGRVGYNKKNVLAGLKLGQQLLKKLKIRNEEWGTNYTRKRSGKLDNRLLSELSFDNYKVFSNMHIDKFKKTYIHISIDASGSMTGIKWNNSIKAAVAIAYAADKIENMDVVIDFRTVTSEPEMPIILIAYNSKKDSFTKVKSLFQYIETGNTTPEGIIFEGMMDSYVQGTNQIDSYFINFSDGMPGARFNVNGKHIYYNHNCTDRFYSDGYRYHIDGVKHTAAQIKKIKAKNIKVLSYFLTESHDDNNNNYWLNVFKRMYGKDAAIIDPHNMAQLAKTLNAKFASK